MKSNYEFCVRIFLGYGRCLRLRAFGNAADSMVAHQSISVRGAEVVLTGLSKLYGDFTAVRDVNLTVAPGEFVTFLGPSGSGKTTTLMMLAGFTVPSEGDVRVDGVSIIDQPVHKRNMGMVFQNYALFPHLDVERNVAFPLEMRGMSRADIRDRVAAALRLVRLDGFEGRRPRQLSGGQQQRVALARALVFEPPILLLDEPLGALDAKLREEMKFELKQLHQKIGATILFVTHDQEEALTLSDRVVVFEKGSTAQIGTPDELYTAPANRFVADFIGETNLLAGAVEAVEGQGCTLRLPGGLRLRGPLRPGFDVPRREACFTLRLESLCLGEEVEGLENVFDGVVEEFLFVGNARKYLIRLSPELTVTARVPAQGQGGAFKPGTRLRVGWPADAMLLVEAS